MDKITLFKSLHNSQIGKDLVEYLKELQNEICDSRKWGKDDTKESADIASRTIQKLIDKIALQNEKKSINTNNFE